MKKVIIIDDEPLARLVVSEYLSSHNHFTIVDQCNNGYEGLKSIEQHKPDLIFLDIQMPKINGFEMLELLDYQPSVVFTTAYDHYALKAFDAAAVDYLLKPFSQERFDQAIEKSTNSESLKGITITEVPNKQPDEHLRIVIKDRDKIKIVPTKNISCIEAYDDYVKIHTPKKTYLKKKTLTHYEQSLNSADFIRIHRSFVINIHFLTGIENYEKNSYRAILSDERRVPISRTAYKSLKEKLGV
ncbi:MAG: LytTR family DNA-binding domain-containing protein [Crocinitomicaceae bacterium]|nr:LytTR family DNA-binding domain-containing protein [Crocinitomicaceae bacterium]